MPQLAQLSIELGHHLPVPLPGQRTGDSVLLDNPCSVASCILALVRPRPLIIIVYFVLKMVDAQHSTTQELECN